MLRILVVSDDCTVTSKITQHVEAHNGSADSLNTSAFFAKGSAAIDGHDCMIMVVDGGFRSQYGGLMQEMTNLIGNCAAKTPLYFMMASDFTQYLVPWSPYAKQSFTLRGDDHRLKDALREIELREAGAASKASFVSPMQSD